MRTVRGTWEITRRELLAGAGVAGVGLALGSGSDAAAVVHRRRKPGSLPFRHLPEGADTLPQIDHIIILMMENHSFDCYLGVLPRLGRAEGGRLPLARLGRPSPVTR